MKNIALCTALVLLFATVAVGEEGYGYQCPPSYAESVAVPIENIEEQIIIQLVICESPVEENGKLLAETLADQMKAMTSPVNGTLAEVKMVDALNQLEKEKKLTVLSRPKMVALNNQLAFIFIGERDQKNQEHGLLVMIKSQIEGDRILTNISGNLNDEQGYFQTNASLQDGVPFFVGGVVKQNPDLSKKEISFYITAQRVICQIQQY